jgi:Ca2+:H+ antiporter
MPRWMYFLLPCTVLAPVLALFHVLPLVLFIIAGLGILPLASLIGTSVEEIAEHTGERIGGILFATFGNATELIIGIFALRQGLVQVVSASIIGSILGNLLLVLGVAVCVGSFRHGRLHFETRPAGQYASLLALCIGGLLLPTVATLLAQRAQQPEIPLHAVELSDFIAILLLIGYLASILYSVFHIRAGSQEEEVDPVLGARSQGAITRLLAYRQQVADSTVPGKTGVLSKLDKAVDAILEHEMVRHTASSAPVEAMKGVAVQKEKLVATREKKPPLWRALLLLAIATIGVAILSEILVSAIEPVTELLHWNPAFVGLVFVPLIGGLPEYFNTISMALDKRIGMVLAASAGSSIQIALLMAPILVLVSLFTPQRLDLVFSIIELAVLSLATFLFSEITRDGELVWLEGLLLMLLYAMMGGTVFLFGS